MQGGNRVYVLLECRGAFSQVPAKSVLRALLHKEQHAGIRGLEGTCPRVVHAVLTGCPDGVRGSRIGSIS